MIDLEVLKEELRAVYQSYIEGFKTEVPLDL